MRDADPDQHQNSPADERPGDRKKFRAPEHSGDSLQLPPLSEVAQLWSDNLALRSTGFSSANASAAGEHSPAPLGQPDATVLMIPLDRLRALGRRELLAAATAFGQQYGLDEIETTSFSRNQLAGETRESEFSTTELPAIVMAGHQPELFHPGVWYKNFVLSQLGQQLNAVAINLVVDNDICGEAAIRFPKVAAVVGVQSLDACAENPSPDISVQQLPAAKVGTSVSRDRAEQLTVGSIPILPPGPNVPFENRLIEDWEFFTKFPERVESAMSQQAPAAILPDQTAPRLVQQLWPEVITAARLLSDNLAATSAQPQPTSTSAVPLGNALAAGRHRLERRAGLLTQEVPLSQLAGTQSFAIFFAAMATHAAGFQDIYNRVLADYRQANRIRSTAHPVPALEQIDDTFELPFWVWQTTPSEPTTDLQTTDGGHVSSVTRQRLFARVNSAQGLLELTDHAGWQAALPLPLSAPANDLGDAPSGHFTAAWQVLQSSGIAIRPRALATTMYARLILSDLFLHGIGGAKYDELTDKIAADFFGVELPSYLTLSATMKLPVDEPLVTHRDIVKLEQYQRELRFHPERFLASEFADADGVQQLLSEKQAWIAVPSKTNAAGERHQAIESLNQQLQTYLVESPQAVGAQAAQLAQQVRRGQILGSREYSWCLFPPSLLDQLKHLARTSAVESV